MAREGFPVKQAYVTPETWATPSTAWDVRDLSDIEVQVVTTPGTAYQPQRSLDGTNYVNCLAYDEAGTSYSTITTAGIYSLSGGGYLKFSAGAGSTITRRGA